MSLKNRFLSVLTLALGIAVFSTVSFAQEQTTEGTAKDKKYEKKMKGGKEGFRGHKGGKFKMRGEGHKGFGMRGGMMRGIDLTDAQKAQIKAIHEANKPAQATRDEMRTIMQARRAGTITEDQKARAQFLREQAQVNRKSVHDQIQSVLTADQKAQIETRKAEMKQRMEERKQKRQEFRQKKTDGVKATPTVG